MDGPALRSEEEGLGERVRTCIEAGVIGGTLSPSSSPASGGGETSARKKSPGAIFDIAQAMARRAAARDGGRKKAGQGRLFRDAR